MKTIKFSFLIFLQVFCLSCLYADDCFKMYAALSQTKSVLQLDTVFTQSGTISLQKNRQAVNGLSISGRVQKTSADYCVRVVLADTEDHEYLVMEMYEELQNDSIFSFSEYCEETALLNNVQTSLLKVYLKDATINLTSTQVSYEPFNNSSTKSLTELRNTIRRNQVSNIVERINAYNRANKRLWLAGETELSRYDYATRKRILGLDDEESSGGWEYYVDGIFEMGHSSLRTLIDNSNDGYVPDFDWRDRHGKNWMTSVKDQWITHFCTAFAALSCVECLVNLYYNQKIDLDLSEQELASCADSVPHHTWEPLTVSMVSNYLQNNGVCDEEVYPFDTSSEIVPCRSGSIWPNEMIWTSGLSTMLYTKDQIKKALFTKGPLWTAILTSGTYAHAMALVGYHTINVGDTIYSVPNTNLYYTQYLIIEPDDPRIGGTYWVFKDNNPNTGYRYLFFHQGIAATLWDAYALLTPISSMTRTDDDIVWEDADGDGLYNWGIGNRPVSCPSWVPYEKDGDDSNPLLGQLNENTGYCYEYDPTHYISQISGTETYQSNVEARYHIFILNGGKLTITKRLHCIGNPIITIEGNGELVVDGGHIYNAEFNLSDHCKLTVKNGGKISMRKGKDFIAPQGCVLNIENGVIEHL